MGNLRTNDTDDFPVESRSGGINYMLVYPDHRERSKTVRADDGFEKEISTVGYQHFKSTKGEKQDLLSELNQIEDSSCWDLLGVWNGRHRSDTFELDINRFRERMKEADL